MATVGGLLDAQTDHHLIRLSLHDTKTHTHLTHTSFNIPSPTTPTPATHTLYVPHLHFPWSPTLCEILYRVLRLRLHPLQTAPHTLSDAPDTFYPALPRPQQTANARTLAKIHATHPAVLPRIAVFVKLAYCNTLLHSLTRLHASTDTSLTRTSPPKHPPTKAIPTHPRPGAAESGRVISTPPHRPPVLPPPPSSPSQSLRIAAHSLPGHRRAPAAFLLHGVAVPAHLLPTTCAILRRYAITVETYAPDPPASLLNLSNRVRHDRRPTPGRGPRMVDDPVDKFVLRAYGIAWPVFCGALVRRAREVVETQRVAELRRLAGVLDEAVAECRSVRETLVAQAIALEVAGSSLARMCAFAIAQSDGEFESDFRRFGRECVRHVGEARQRIWQLSAEETRSAAVLVAGMKGVR